MLYIITDILLKVALKNNKTGRQIIHDTLLKVALSTNKTGHHVIHYTEHIVESGVNHQ